MISLKGSDFIFLNDLLDENYKSYLIKINGQQGIIWIFLSMNFLSSHFFGYYLMGLVTGFFTKI